MTAPALVPIDVPSTRRFLPVLLLLFVGSGCSALIYEIVWFQLLQLVIGSSAVSLAVLLGTFMGGMCLGSLLLPRLIGESQHPLRVYGLLELGIGIFGLLVLFGIPLIDSVYAALNVHGFFGIVLRALVSVVCLLPSTLLMGASLPAIARWIETTREGVSWLGFFYGGNIAGAVFGCLLAGFYLLRVHDMHTATYVAVAINIGVALISIGLASIAPHSKPATEITQGRPGASKESWPIYAAIAISGMCALGGEVIWTRLLGLMIGATVYTFSIILAVFLVGLGLGSSVGSFLAKSSTRPRVAFGICQMLLAGAVAWSAIMLASSLPYWPIDLSLSKNPWFNFQLDLARCAWVILPPACLWGASFPLALAAVASRGQDPGRLVGGLYAANTIGAIAGATVFGMLLIPSIGTRHSQQVLIGMSAISALIVLIPLFRRNPGEQSLGMGSAAWLLASLAIAVMLGRNVSNVPFNVYGYGRQAATTTQDSEVLYLGEGMNSSIAISQWTDGARFFHVSGKVEASTEPHDMRLQRMLGHISALYHQKPTSVLIVGFGAGVTAGSFVLHPDIKRIVICEIEPLIPPAANRFFAQQNYGLLTDARVEMVYDDARHYILTSREKFDIITSDPIHPWVKGAATLYSKEYFEMAKRHLNPGGVITQWVPLYESNPETVKSEIATFFDVFPGGTIWSNDIDGSGYDVMLLGQTTDTKVDVDQLQQRLDRPDHFRVARSLRDVGFYSAYDLVSTYAGRKSDLKPWLEGAEINRDRNLRLQYLAGMGSNLYQGPAIFNEIIRYRAFPDGIVTGFAKNEQMLRSKLRVFP